MSWPQSPEAFRYPGNQMDWWNAVSPAAVLAALSQALPHQTGGLAIPNMSAGQLIEVGFPASDAFIGRTAVLAAFVGAPLAQLGICGTWVSGTGVVNVRFIAGLGGVNAGNQNVGVVALL